MAILPIALTKWCFCHFERAVALTCVREDLSQNAEYHWMIEEFSVLRFVDAERRKMNLNFKHLDGKKSNKMPFIFCVIVKKQFTINQWITYLDIEKNRESNLQFNLLVNQLISRKFSNIFWKTAQSRAQCGIVKNLLSPKKYFVKSSITVQLTIYFEIYTWLQKNWAQPQNRGNYPLCVFVLKKTSHLQVEEKSGYLSFLASDLEDIWILETPI